MFNSLLRDWKHRAVSEELFDQAPWYDYLDISTEVKNFVVTSRWKKIEVKDSAKKTT